METHLLGAGMEQCLPTRSIMKYGMFFYLAPHNLHLKFCPKRKGYDVCKEKRILIELLGCFILYPSHL